MTTEKKRFVILLEPELFEELKMVAEEQNRSTGNLIVTIAKEYLKNYKK